VGYWWGDEERLDEDVAVFVDVDDGSKDEVCVAAAASIETAIVGSGAGAADDGMVGCFPAAAAAADQFFFFLGGCLSGCLPLSNTSGTEPSKLNGGTVPQRPTGPATKLWTPLAAEELPNKTLCCAVSEKKTHTRTHRTF